MQFYPTFDSDSIRPYLPAYPVLLPASSWARQRRAADEALPVPCIPPQVPEIAADGGGYAAAQRAKKLGLDDGYSYTPEQYVVWLQALGPRLSWAATFDWCCEPSVASDADAVRQRQARTTAMAWSFWQTWGEAPWAWVPTIQGWSIANYRQHTRELRPLIAQMARQYRGNPAWRVGIGSICQRASVSLIRQVCAAVAEELPGVPLHLWGVSLRLLLSRVALPVQVASVDSSTWNRLWYRGREAWRGSGLPQRYWTISVALPQTLAAFERARATPKQLVLLAG